MPPQPKYLGKFDALGVMPDDLQDPLIHKLLQIPAHRREKDSKHYAKLDDGSKRRFFYDAETLQFYVHANGENCRRE